LNIAGSTFSRTSSGVAHRVTPARSTRNICGRPRSSVHARRIAANASGRYPRSSPIVHRRSQCAAATASARVSSATVVEIAPGGPQKPRADLPGRRLLAVRDHDDLVARSGLVEQALERQAQRASRGGGYRHAERRLERALPGRSEQRELATVSRCINLHAGAFRARPGTPGALVEVVSDPARRHGDRSGSPHGGAGRG
jgi:hypothetical protein